MPGIIFVTAEMVEILPAEDARIVEVIELDLYGVVANRLEFHHPCTCRRPGTVCFWSGTWLWTSAEGLLDLQKLRRQFEKASVVESDLVRSFSSLRSVIFVGQ